jgi:preprotein translocase subunit SecE
MAVVEDDVTKDVSMSSTDLPEESKPRSSDHSVPPAPRTSAFGSHGPIQFISDVRLEMKKVSWPNRSEVMSTTVVVLIAVLFFSLYLWGVDTLLEKFFLQIETWLGG